MLVLIAFHRSALLFFSVICPLHIILSSQFTIDFNQIHMKTWWWPFHYLLFSKSFMLKEFIDKLRYMRNVVMHRYILHFKSARLGLASCKENLVHKITIVSTVQFNSNFEWSNNGLVDNSSSSASLPTPTASLQKGKTP